jgi:hypothetical protein
MGIEFGNERNREPLRVVDFGDAMREAFKIVVDSHKTDRKMAVQFASYNVRDDQPQVDAYLNWKPTELG